MNCDICGKQIKHENNLKRHQNTKKCINFVNKMKIEKDKKRIKKKLEKNKLKEIERNRKKLERNRKKIEKEKEKEIEKEIERNRKKIEKERLKLYKEILICPCSSKIYSRLQTLRNHQKTCITHQISLVKKEHENELELKDVKLKLKDRQILMLENEIKRLNKNHDMFDGIIKDLNEKSQKDRDVIDKIASKSKKNINTTTINNDVKLIYRDRVAIIRDNFTDVDAIRGLDGLIDCLARNNKIIDENGVVKHIFKAKDKSRGNIKYLNDKHVKISDFQCINLINEIQHEVKIISEKNIKKIYGVKIDDKKKIDVEYKNLEKNSNLIKNSNYFSTHLVKMF
jgi:hypothetical protein